MQQNINACHHFSGLSDPYSKYKLTPLNHEENTKQGTGKGCGQRTGVFTVKH